MQAIPRQEKLKKNIHFIKKIMPKAKQFMLSSIDTQKIKPLVIEAKGDMDNLFKWWNLTWWSIPHERSCGRQMRFIVWDEYHNAPIGLIGLQSPILKWKARDEYLNIKDHISIVNQSMSAQRLGALPPYNMYLGGKLVASLMVSDTIRKAYYEKYKEHKIPARLLFITTTGAYGKSPVYNRLDNCKFIGWSHGSGSFHISNALYEELIIFLRKNGYKAGRAFGHGASTKIKNISLAMRLLGFKNGAQHGAKRAVYLFSFVKNLKEVIQGEKEIWKERNIENITNQWKKRWGLKRKNIQFSYEDFLSKLKYF